MNNVKSISFFTFATFGEGTKYRDYSEKCKALRENLANFGIEVHLLTLNDLKESFSTKQIQILELRKGAGYWTWKPNVLEYAIKNTDSDVVVYLDCDLVFHVDPTETILDSLLEAELSAFRQHVPLGANTSNSCLDYFRFPSISQKYMWTASLIAFRRKSPKVKEFVNNWKSLCGNSRLLIDPFLDFSRRHRHDQSIFSCLIYDSDLSVSDLGEGFYSHGIENRSADSTTILVSHGDLLRSETKKGAGIRAWIGFCYSKLLFAKWRVLTFLGEKKSGN